MVGLVDLTRDWRRLKDSMDDDSSLCREQQQYHHHPATIRCNEDCNTDCYALTAEVKNASAK